MLLWLVGCAMFTDKGQDPSSTPDTATPDDTDGCSNIFLQVDICNGLDDDCDGQVDEDPELSWYVDKDGDGHGTGTLQVGCDVPTSSSQTGGDCDDERDDVYPGADEYCDGVDNDCNGDIDPPTSVDAIRWTQDNDHDGYGWESDGVLVQCDQPNGYAELDGDCDNGVATVNPGAPEICLNEVDDDCSGKADDGCILEHCGSIVANETWDESFIHLITCDVHVGDPSDPQLTIAEGSRVWFEDGTVLTSGEAEPGRIVVAGTSAKPVTLISSKDWYGVPFAGIWVGVRIGGQDSGSDFTFMDMSHAGQNGAAIDVTSASIGLQDSSVVDTDGYGIRLDAVSAFSSFGRNTLTHNIFPVILPGNAAGAMDSLSTYEPNAENQVVLLAEPINTDVTLAAMNSASYRVTGDIALGSANGATLTLEDGVSMVFNKDAGLTVGFTAPATLNITGTSLGVTMGSADQQTPGEWDGVSFAAQDEGSELTGLVIQYGGGNGEGCLDINGADILVSSSTVQDCANDGIKLRAGTLELESSTITDAADSGLQVTGGTLGLLTGTTVSGSGIQPVRVPANSVGAVDGTNTLTGNGDDTVIVSGGVILSDATLADLDVSWTIEADVSVQGANAPTLTISDGAEVQFKPGASLLIGETASGALDIQGTSVGVVMRSAEAQPASGDWGGVLIGSSTTSASIEGLTLQYAGDGVPGLYILADATVTDSTFSDIDDACVAVDGAELVFQDNALSKCISGAVVVEATGTLGASEDFSGNSITSCNEPVEMPAECIDAIAEDNSISGNGNDRVLLVGGDVSADSTWRAIGVPWAVEGDISVTSGATLTVDPGVEVFWTGGGLVVGEGSSGALDVQGTSSSIVLFTGDQTSPVAGDWDGISFGSSCDTSLSGLSWLEVGYGGAAGTGNVSLESCDLTFSNVLLTSSAAYGLYSVTSTPSLSGVVYQNNTLGDTN
jgi:hypothetical protein